MRPSLATTLTCPICGQQTIETMRVNQCVFFRECPGCKTVLKPKPGDCCVFCSYADQPCPSVQGS